MISYAFAPEAPDGVFPEPPFGAKPSRVAELPPKGGGGSVPVASRTVA